MAEPQTEPKTEPQAEPQAGGSGPARDPVRLWSWALLAPVTLLLAWHIASDRATPRTGQARVQAWVVPIAPKVSGRVDRVAIAQDQAVAAGDLLAVIDERKYALAVQRAQAALELAGQEIGAQTSAVAAAGARLVEAVARHDETEVRYRRIERAAQQGAIAPAELDRARAQRDEARARVDSAQAELEQAKQALGPEGADNPRVREAVAALGQARLDLADTRITAPGVGGITNLVIDEGHYAAAGKPIMTFISDEDVWVQANFRENAVGVIQPGDRVEIVLDMLPGRVFSGTVSSRGFAVGGPGDTQAGGLATIKDEGGWIREAQRFPVLIRFNDESAYVYRFVGGRADVQVYTQHSGPVLDALGWAWIRAVSWASYVY